MKNKEMYMLKRAAGLVLLSSALFMTSFVHAGDFLINVPKTVKRGDRINIEVKADQSTASQVKLSITSRAGTDNYDLELVNGAAVQEHTFNDAGSIILKVADAADPKHFTTKSLHVLVIAGVRQ